MNSRSITQNIDHIPVENIVVELFVVGENVQESSLYRALSFFCHGSNKLFSHTVENERGCDCFVQGSLVLKAHRFDEFTDQRLGVPRKDAKGITTGIRRTRGAQFDDNVAGIFARTLSVESAIFTKARGKWVLPLASRLGSSGFGHGASCRP
jgi:hypothetical protein